MNKISEDLYYVGVNDHQIDLFEGQYEVKNGIAYNSYVFMDDYIAIFDTVDIRFFDEWIKNVKEVLGNKKPHYLIVHHMEPDHSANIIKFLEIYPDTIVVSTNKAFQMMDQFFHKEINHKKIVGEGDFINIGHHKLTFIMAPMVHWPEVMVSYDENSKTLFSADGFGKFGALDVDEEWDCEARRYYFGIVGKYGPQVQALLKKASNLDIKTICPLHGPILKDNLDHYLHLYDLWSSYNYETEGVAIFYTSIYGHTKEAAELLKECLIKNKAPKVELIDLAREDIYESVEDAFRYQKIVLATTTYNAEIFPIMNDFLNRLVERNYQNRVVGIIENGSWAPMAATFIKNKFKNLKNISYVEPIVTIKSSMSDENKTSLQSLADSLCANHVNKDVKEKENASPKKALFNIGYGLYVVTSNDGNKDNGMICNSVTQVTSNPERIAVCINKSNYSHDTIKTTKKLNLNILNEEAPFALFKKFGFVSGRDHNKFEGDNVSKSSNGLVILNNYVNSYISLKVEEYVDLNTHGMFICSIVDSKVLNNTPTMTYSYYQSKVKPKPETKKKGWVCKICGYVYEGDELPSDFICPICKHGAADFERIK